MTLNDFILVGLESGRSHSVFSAWRRENSKKLDKQDLFGDALGPFCSLECVRRCLPISVIITKIDDSREALLVVVSLSSS